ncbi:MAG: TonB family protein [Luminiphilus sp.]
MRAGVRPGMPPAVLLSIGIHLVVIFGFLVTPMGDSAARVASRAVSVLLMPSERAPTAALTDALDNQSGVLETLDSQVFAMRSEPVAADTGTEVTQGTQSGLTMTAHAGVANPRVAARATPDAAYLKAWQADIERFGNAYYRGLALRYGDGDVRLRVTVAADGGLRAIDLLTSSGIEALDQAAVHTVEQLAPFAPFPPALAATTSELAIIRTWQFRR